MASGPAKTADDLSDSVKSIVDRVLEADIRRQISRRGQEMAALVAEATGAAADRAADAWKDSESTRREAGKSMKRARRDAAKWSSRTWRRELQPTLRDLWKRRTVAIGAAGAAVPAGRELVDSAAVRLGLRERQEHRHWGAFFLGLLIGAAAGAIIALLSAPKPGREIRDELTERGRGVAGDLASRARENDWVPLFQRPEATGVALPERSDRTSGAGDVAGDDAGQAINESFNESGVEASGEVVAETGDEVTRPAGESTTGEPIDVAREGEER